MKSLKGKKIAILATNGFEESELMEPKNILEKSGAEVTVISPEGGKIKAWKDGNWSKEINVDLTLENASENEYDCLILPGGVINPDKLRRSSKAVDFVRSFVENKKLIAAICHGPQLLIDTGIIKGRTMTSFHAIKIDLINAGVNWIDSEVVVDENIITSRKPSDIEAFTKKIIELLFSKE
jgi:protease I